MKQLVFWVVPVAPKCRKCCRTQLDSVLSFNCPPTCRYPLPSSSGLCSHWDLFWPKPIMNGPNAGKIIQIIFSETQILASYTQILASDTNTRDPNVGLRSLPERPKSWPHRPRFWPNKFKSLAAYEKELSLGDADLSLSYPYLRFLWYKTWSWRVGWMKTWTDFPFVLQDLVHQSNLKQFEQGTGTTDSILPTDLLFSFLVFFTFLFAWIYNNNYHDQTNHVSNISITFLIYTCFFERVKELHE